MHTMSSVNTIYVVPGFAACRPYALFVDFGAGFLVYSARRDGYGVVRNLSFTDRKILRR